nr:hypothetical protein [Tanacetum cinerariifolium]
MSVVYVLTTPIPEDGGDDVTMKQIRKRATMMTMSAEHTLKHLKEELTLFELGSHLRIEESLRMQDSDKPKGNNVVGPLVVNMVEHNNSSRYNDNKGKHIHHDNTRVDPNRKSKVTFWRCRKPGHLKKDYKGVNVSNKVNDSGTKGLVNGSSSSLKGATVHACKDRCWFKTYDSLNDGIILHIGNESTAWCMDIKRKPNLNYLRVWGCRAVVRLFDPKLKTLSERGIECIFVEYAEHSKAFRFYLIEANDSVLINSIFESRDAIFDKNRFSSVPKPSHRSLVNETKDIGCSVVTKEVTEDVVQRPKPDLRKDKRNRSPKDFRTEFPLYVIERTRDEVSYQHSYCFNVDDDPKTFNEAMKSQDVVFWKKAINDEMDSIIGNNTWLLADLPPGCKTLGCKCIFKRKLKMDVKTAFLNGDLNKEAPKQWHQKFDEVVLSNRYLLNQADKCVYRKFNETSKGVIREANVILGIRIKYESNGIAISQSHYIKKSISQLKYSRVIGCLMYATTCTRLDISFAVGKVSGYTSNPVLEGYTNASWINNSKDNSSISSWVFLLGGGAIFWASKKQTYITGSTMEYEFVALAVAGKESEWLKNLFLKIPLWSKPIAPISICCDSAATLAKAYRNVQWEV